MNLESLRDFESVAVFKNKQRAGILQRNSVGARFIYDEGFRLLQLHQNSYGVCYSLPPTQPEHIVQGTNLHPFFAGLLPEGLRLKALYKSLKTSEDDLFTLLLASGTQCIGDVFAKLELSAEDRVTKPIEVADFHAASFWDLFEKSITATDFQMREHDPAISGVMPKISASMVSFPLRIAKRKHQYILKLEPKDHPHLLHNEHFFMQLAKRCGFAVPRTHLVQDRDECWGLLVERFDRIHVERKTEVVRLHQEDACQFLARYPQDKYRISLSEIAEGIKLWTSSPVTEIRRLLALYLFSYLIGNGDLHAKNISVLEDIDGRTTLSPVYDLLSTLPYGDRRMALKLGAKDDGFTLSDIIMFAKRYEISEKSIRALARSLIKSCEQYLPQITTVGLSEKSSADILRTFTMRAKRLA